MQERQGETLIGAGDGTNVPTCTSQQLRDKDVEEIVTDVQRLARRYPSVFIGSAFALGVVGARFFKSSSRSQGGFDREYGRESSTSPTTYDTGANTSSGASASFMQSSSLAGSSSSIASPASTGKATGTPRRRTPQTERS